MAEARLDLTDELLVAYVDDELDPVQRDMVVSVLEGNPVLRRRAEEMRLARDLLQEAFPLQPEAGVPAGIVKASTRLAAAASAPPSQAASNVFAFRRHHAIAAGVLLCALAGALTYFFVRPTAQQPLPMVTALTQIASANPLHGVLETTPSAQLVKIPGEDAAVRAVLTFEARDGRFCREFEILADAGSSTGIACRQDGHWRTEVLASSAGVPGTGSSYTPAAASDEAAVAKIYDALIQGEPLGIEEEARVLASRWRRNP